MEILYKPCNTGNYEKGRTVATNGPLYIIMHHTAGNGDTARGNLSYFNRNGNINASAHFFIDEKTIGISVLPDNTAWSIGAKTYKTKFLRNKNTINIELCSRIDSKGHFYYKDRTLENAIKIITWLKGNYSIVDVFRHFDATGKNCPSGMVANQLLWYNFKQRVYKAHYNADDEEMQAITKIINNAKSLS